MTTKKFVLIAVLIVMATVACQPKKVGPQIQVQAAWGRPSPMVAMAGAFYMLINNTGSEPDKLISISSSACGKAELHESYMKEDGVMGMKMVEGGTIEVPPGDSIEMKPGGMHVMCIEKQANFALGEIYELVLTFEKTGELKVEVEIKEP